MKVKKGFVLVEGTDSLYVAKLCVNTWRGYAEIVGIDAIPDFDEQSNYTWSEGAPGVNADQIVCRISPEQLFDFLKAKIVIGRIEKRFPNIKGYLPIKNKIIIMIKSLCVPSYLESICESIIGVYPRSSVYFCSNNHRNANVIEIQKSLLRGELPTDWQMACGDKGEWKNTFLLPNRSPKENIKLEVRNA